MNIALMVIVAFLASILIGLIFYNLSIHRKIKGLSNTSEKIANLRILQDFMDTIAQETSVENKIRIINDILIEKYENIKYSTIVVFNGAEYILKASNTDERLWDNMKNLHTDPIFQESIKTATPKYITINSPEEKLAYQKVETSRAKSAMFFPLYIDNIYIGYWIIESNEPNAFDNMDTNILEIIRENIIGVLKTITYQNTLENIYRVDKTTGLSINRYGKSTVCMFIINNIEAINETYGRKAGTQIIINVANNVKSNIISDYVFVRYMGPKFAIVFSGLEIETAVETVTKIKQDIENVRLVITNKKNKKEIHVCPKTNFVLGTYYKGTGIEEVTKKLEEYLDNADKTESTINYV